MVTVTQQLAEGCRDEQPWLGLLSTTANIKQTVRKLHAVTATSGAYLPREDQRRDRRAAPAQEADGEARKPLISWG
jgi:hypothetical protein